jgi:hypothetical protein
MQFQRKHLLAAWRIKARRHVEFAEDSSPAMLVGSDSLVDARQGRETAAAHRGREAVAELRDSHAAAHQNKKRAAARHIW